MHATARPGLSLVLALAAACGDPPATGGADMSAPPEPPKWERGLSRTTDLYAPRRGLRDVRGIIHLHSVYSHDACDNKPLPDGMPAQPCHQDLRDGLCAMHEDFVMLTDHDTHFSDQTWDKLFLPFPGDEKVLVDGQQVAAWLACPDGSRILLQIGSENEVMPIGLDSQVAGTATERHKIMGGSDDASYAAFRAHGALVAFAHTEQHSLEQLRAANADAVEVYNLHANIDPRIRELMGMDPTAPITRLGPFFRLDETVVPDLAFLAIDEDLPAEQTKFNALLAEGRRVFGSAGTDAHENTFAMPMADGERGDSYRRMLRWFSNHLLLAELGPTAVKDAIKGGRGYVLFEAFGPAKGFDARVEAGGKTVEIGGEVALADGPEIAVEPPRVDLAPGQEAPAITTRIILADRPEGTIVATGDGAATLRFKPAKAGAYRVEVRITPNHLKFYMGSAQAKLLREFSWVLANPFYVK